MWDLIVSVPDHCLSFYFGLSLTHRTIFKFCSDFSENAIFETIVKNLFPQKFQLLSVFQSGAPRCSCTQ